MITTIWHFLVKHGLYNDLVSASIFVLCFPAIKAAWRSHHEQLWTAAREDLSKIIDLLDTSTTGGMSEIKSLLEELRDRS